MAKYMISFPSGEMTIPAGEFDAVVEESHRVIRDMKAAGVYVFGGGIDEGVPTVLVDADGGVEQGTYPQTSRLDGGCTIIEAPTRDVAIEWAARVARACRCRQELRVFGFDPES